MLLTSLKSNITFQYLPNRGYLHYNDRHLKAVSREKMNKQELRRKNPYLHFLAEIEEVEDDSVQRGLDTWLGTVGPLVMPQAVPGMDNKKPWMVQKRSEDDLVTMNVQETMCRISKDFCSWLKKLPGKDKTINDCHESSIRNLFDVSRSGNPVNNTLAKGLCSWARFGATANYLGKSVQEQTGALQLSTFLVENHVNKDQIRRPKKRSKRRPNTIFNKENKMKRIGCYGAWYIDPRQWYQRFILLYNRDDDASKDNHKISMEKNFLEQQREQKLPVMKAFDDFLGEIEGYRKPKFLTKILKTEKR